MIFWKRKLRNLVIYINEERRKTKKKDISDELLKSWLKK